MDAATRLLKSELIGRQVLMTRIKDNHAIKARIIDETKNTVVVHADNNKKRLIKALYAFTFEEGGRAVRMAGSLFQKRPEERIKSKLMKRW